MQELITRFQTDQVALVQLILFLAVFIIAIVNTVRLSKVKKKVGVLTHNHDGLNIEDLINKYYDEIDKVKKTQEEIVERQSNNSATLARSITKVGMVRFNPFGEVGGDQSFAIALLDDQNNGIVISSLYGRANSRFYGKPIANGCSSYSLSDEEEEAIKKAMQKQAS